MLARYRVSNVALEGRFDPIKADAVVGTANEGDIFRMRPAQGHGCAGGQPPPHCSEIFSVPQLFAEHAPFVGELFHRGDKRHGIPSGSEFVMPALAGQNRPRAADAGSIESTAVILLSIAIVIVSAPAGTLGQVTLERAIHDR